MKSYGADTVLADKQSGDYVDYKVDKRKVFENHQRFLFICELLCNDILRNGDNWGLKVIFSMNWYIVILSLRSFLNNFFIVIGITHIRKDIVSWTLRQLYGIRNNNGNDGNLFR